MINKITAFLLLFAFSSFPQTKMQETNTGAIFGKVGFYKSKNNSPIIVILIEKNKIIETDREGYFYINNLKPGLYNLKIHVDGLKDHFADSIRVIKDKISCVLPIYINKMENEKNNWSIIEYQKKIEPIRYGKIEGYVVYEHDGIPKPNATILYGGLLWEEESDSSGYFKIDKVVPGHYAGIGAIAERYKWWGRILEFDVKPDSVSRIKIKLFKSPDTIHFN